MVFINESLLLLSAVSALIILCADYVESNKVQVNTTIDNVQNFSNLLFYKKMMLDSDGVLWKNLSSVCDSSSAIDNFPHDMFTNKQRLEGAIIIHFFVAFYFFIMLGTICSRYFIPSVECICEDLKIPPDVAAATFMSLATTTPEFFTNTISTLIADSNMGLGTIIGSMLFNTLGVSAVAGLATRSHVQLHHWPILRDCIIFTINLIVLTVITWDGVIVWYESVIQVVLLGIYFAIMFQSVKLQNFIHRLTKGKCSYALEADLSHKYNEKDHRMDSGIITCTTDHHFQSKVNTQPPVYTIHNLYQTQCEMHIKAEDLKQPLMQQPAFDIFWWIFTYPIRIVLFMTIPNPLVYRRFYLFSFIMSMIMLAFTSYVIFWMIAVIGFSFGIPESIMGMTFLAAGGCLPEATSAFIMARKGNGDIGVSNSLGANSLSILFSLGVPWFVRIMKNGGPFTNAFINIRSDGMEYVVISLIAAVAVLYSILTFSSYKLRKTAGIVLAACYCVFVTFPVLVEMNILFPSDNKC